jgi:hypothetical protein
MLPATSAPVSGIGHFRTSVLDGEQFIIHSPGRGLTPKNNRDCVFVLALILKSAMWAKDCRAADHHTRFPSDAARGRRITMAQIQGDFTRPISQSGRSTAIGAHRLPLGSVRPDRPSDAKA